MGLAGTVGETTLSIEQIAVHDHSSGQRFGSKFGGGGLYGLNGDSGGVFSTLPTGGSQPHDHPLEGGTDQADSLPPFLSFEMVVRVA